MMNEVVKNVIDGRPVVQTGRTSWRNRYGGKFNRVCWYIQFRYEDNGQAGSVTQGEWLRALDKLAPKDVYQYDPTIKVGDCLRWLADNNSGEVRWGLVHKVHKHSLRIRDGVTGELVSTDFVLGRTSAGLEAARPELAAIKHSWWSIIESWKSAHGKDSSPPESWFKVLWGAQAEVAKKHNLDERTAWQMWSAV